MTFNPQPKPVKPPFTCAWPGCAIHQEYGHTGYCPWHYSIRLRTRSKGEKMLDEAKAQEIKKPKSEFRRLVEEADKWFSLWVRLSAADSNGNVKCYTSGKVYHFKQIQAGHFMSRRHYATRWEPENVKPQSVAENMFNQGNQAKFAQELQKEYGVGIVEKLQHKANNKFKLHQFFIKLIIKEYKEKVLKIASEKGFEI